ncbi:hypothetical protein [Alkalihalobacillus trypoxylicola]|uniref:Uncharacterized protein n=1 Tax=Alkalihalobacillus trypoxylicola TaxID=519424 RepID=A0A162CM27_9BACI|nr:hypothetical protein [Alkalihalobacillus trypoxylicola]KYG25531.1 hypothetical protein AZF04_13655 [Alkalihalobacillus trypoxylicola]
MELRERIKSFPTWLKWTFRIFLGYLSLLALVLASTIIVILVTFSMIMIDFFSGADSMRDYAENNLVPISEYMWNLFTLLVPGL